MLIKNGKVLMFENEDVKVENLDIRIEDENISEIRNNIKEKENEKVNNIKIKRKNRSTGKQS